MSKQPKLGDMMKGLQQMQADMAAAQAALATEVLEGRAGGGSVVVKITGALELREVTIDPAAIDPDDPELLSDLVMAAVNEAIRAAQAHSEQRMAEASKGLQQLAGPAGLGALGL